jgi:hypothetical protein
MYVCRSERSESKCPGLLEGSPHAASAAVRPCSNRLWRSRRATCLQALPSFLVRVVFGARVATCCKRCRPSLFESSLALASPHAASAAVLPCSNRLWRSLRSRSLTLFGARSGTR